MNPKLPQSSLKELVTGGLVELGARLRILVLGFGMTCGGVEIEALFGSLVWGLGVVGIFGLGFREDMLWLMTENRWYFPRIRIPPCIPAIYLSPGPKSGQLHHISSKSQRRATAFLILQLRKDLQSS